MGKMEEFIRSNREAFDVHEVPDKLWEKIELRLQSNRRTKAWKAWLQRAAIFILIFSMAFALSEYIHKPKSKQVISAIENEQTLPQEIKETQVYYETRIHSRMTEMKPMFASYPGMEEEVHKDFTRLDSICADLKRDLKDNVSNKQVLEAMIENYRTKLGILESLLDALKRKNPSHEKIHI
jgi:DNA repair exonuclease SbcCD ATPase subunit